MYPGNQKREKECCWLLLRNNKPRRRVECNFWKQAKYLFESACIHVIEITWLWIEKMCIRDSVCTLSNRNSIFTVKHAQSQTLPATIHRQDKCAFSRKKSSTIIPRVYNGRKEYIFYYPIYSVRIERKTHKNTMEFRQQKDSLTIYSSMRWLYIKLSGTKT